MKRLLSKRFRLEEVDEYLTSKTYNRFFEKLNRYRWSDGTLSYTRLRCPNLNCGGERVKLCPQFVDRDKNAAANILLVGASCERPKAFCRASKRPAYSAGISSRR